MEASFRNLVERESLAIGKLVGCLEELGELSPEQARQVAGFYLDKKLAKLDRANGTFHVKHGGLLDKDVIRRAAGLL